MMRGGGWNRRAAVLIALGVVSVAVFRGVSEGAGSKEPLDVGMVVALTGSLAGIDGPYIDGVKLAVNKVNAAGGAGGHPIQLHIVDGASTATTGVTVANQLLSQFKIALMINGASSATNQALVPIIAARQLPVISQGQLPEEPRWTFLATAAYQKHMALQLAFAARYLHASSIAFLYSQTPYGQLGAKLLTTSAPSMGLKVVLSLAVDASATDLSSVMAQVKDANPAAVVDFLTGSTHLVEAKGAATVGLKSPIVMGIDATDPVSAATRAYAASYFVATPAQVYPKVTDLAQRAATKAFVDEYTQAGKDPSLIGTAGYGWDAGLMVGKAAQAAPSISGPALRAALETLTLQGSESLYRFTPEDHTGQQSVPSPLVIAQVRGTALQTVYATK